MVLLQCTSLHDDTKIVINMDNVNFFGPNTDGGTVFVFNTSNPDPKSPALSEHVKEGYEEVYAVVLGSQLTPEQ